MASDALPDFRVWQVCANPGCGVEFLASLRSRGKPNLFCCTSCASDWKAGKPRWTKFEVQTQQEEPCQTAAS